MENPNIDKLIEALNESSKRSRSLIIGLLFASLLCLIALLNSLNTNLNWYDSRIMASQMALDWFIFPGENPEIKGSSSLIDFISTAESNHRDSMSINKMDALLDHIGVGLFYKVIQKEQPRIENILPDWVKIKPIPGDLNFNADERKQLYSALIQSSMFISIRHIYSREALSLTHEHLIENKIEHLMFIRMPIIGITFDINHLGYISAFVFFALMMLLYLSMVRENRNLKTIFFHGWDDKLVDDRKLYELLSMFQVLTVPFKLYTSDKKKDKITRRLIFFVFWLPALIFLFVIINDILSIEIGYSVNPFLTNFSLCVSFILLFFVFWAAYKLSNRQSRIDRIWDNQYYRLNLEKLFDVVSTNNLDEIWISPDQIILNWSNIIDEMKHEKARVKRELTEKECTLYIEKFIDNCYNEQNESRADREFEKEKEKWEAFKKCFNTFKNKSSRKIFRDKISEYLNEVSSTSAT